MNIKNVVIASVVSLFGVTLSISAYANTNIEPKDEIKTNYSGIIATLSEHESQQILIDEAEIYKTAQDNYYYCKWLDEVRRQVEEWKAHQEEQRVSYEGDAKIVDIPTSTYTLATTMVEIPNPELQPLEQPTEEKPAMIEEPLEYLQEVNYKGLKTYMDYRTITATSSPQWALEHLSDDYQLQVDTIMGEPIQDAEKLLKIAMIDIPEKHIYTDEKGFRRLHCQNPYDSGYTERYVIAVASGVTSKIGQYVDLIMENGEVVPCVVGDQKADAHTDYFNHLMTSIHNPNNACASEFIVEQDKINSSIVANGDSSYGLNLVGVKVASIKVYNKNALN